MASEIRRRSGIRDLLKASKSRSEKSEEREKGKERAKMQGLKSRESRVQSDH